MKKLNNSPNAIGENRSAASYIAELLRELDAMAAREGLSQLCDRLRAAEAEARKALARRAA